MPKRKEPELSQTEQFKRFREAAKKADLTESEEEFEKAFKKVVRPPARRKLKRQEPTG